MQNSVTQQRIDELLDKAQFQEAIFWGKELVISYLLESGFTVLGRAACVDPRNFNLEVGRKIAREDAENKLWQLEGYALQLELAARKAASETGWDQGTCEGVCPAS